MSHNENPRPDRQRDLQPDWRQLGIEGTADRGTDATSADRTASMLLTIPAAARVLSIGRTKTYELIGRGDLEVVHIDGSARVPIDAVRSYVEQLRAEVAESKPRIGRPRIVKLRSSPPGDSQPPAA